MNKNDMVSIVSKCASVTRAEAYKCINCYHYAIQGALEKGDSVSFVGFGTFKVSRRKARIGRNPKTGSMLEIPARKVPVFKAGKSLKEAVK
jgi:DNA-binding protein HU-beta